MSILNELYQLFFSEFNLLILLLLTAIFLSFLLFCVLRYHFSWTIRRQMLIVLLILYHLRIEVMNSTKMLLAFSFFLLRRNLIYCLSRWMEHIWVIDIFSRELGISLVFGIGISSYLLIFWLLGITTFQILLFQCWEVIV